MGDHGGCRGLIRSNPGFRSGVYMYKGKLTSEVLGRLFSLPHKDIELLLAAL
jgi:alanine dehydrogenase